ncbi:hypothetical protein LTR10_024423 [Elasticomyces elasticus]|uniref:NAD(P)-binding protein n=1 Tax=Exophiala sideris TaxID=1016849 RepID=A0ABR0J9G4_9EURO|nr:hypothetical protein LTR10_024423 [Elasticomyces elasticus]KAK5022741.1 hypothetical protein LTS07_009718 [Exophiala sideris]KAK5026643.1 hypothetical protein LTR13_009866 [Exophiala sideris]KAK5059369.1 hypothetical protein LTR69_005957 [Exophiala sideris]KAK5177486.1 hypothetical protein LTR44_010103 [Eurotiomycetes sp. CCFEE 6388]
MSPRTNAVLETFSNFTVLLNRVLAWVDFLVHYISGYLLFLFLGGLRPQYHTRAKRGYTPSVIITGASQGIGLATTRHLASKGYNVFATVKDEVELAKLAEDITDDAHKHLAPRIHFVIMNVLDQSSIDAALAAISSTVSKSPNSPLIALINNAGYCMISPMELTPPKALHDIFDLDFFAYVSTIRAFLPLLKQSSGRVINVVSYGAYINPPMWAPYAAIKAGLEAMTRAWRFELIPFGVGMTSIRPGWTRTAGIGPKISTAWRGYSDQIDKGAVGVNSLGEVVRSDYPVGHREKEVYSKIMHKWYNMTMAAAEGAAQPAEAVALTIHDALSDVFLQPYYTVGYDALLGQMVRDLCPESLYELSMIKTFL